MEIVNMIIKAYIKVMGEDKWNSLSAEQQHKVIMTIAADAHKVIDNI